MAIPVACGSCGSRMNAPDHAAGKTAKCPKCSNPITVPVKYADQVPFMAIQPPQQLTPIPQNIPAIYQQPVVQTPSSSKQCDYCGENVNMSAKKCKHCGEILDLALRAAEDAKRIAENSSRNSASSSSAAAVNTTVVVNNNLGRKSFPHLIHFILTCLTLGAWLPIWIIHFLLSALLSGH